MNPLTKVADQPVVYTRLREDRPQIAFFAEGCLPGRSPLSRCTDCADACPVGALSAARGRLELSDACIRCGRCAAACPTGAIRAAGFEPESSWATRDRAATVECWRVPAAAGEAVRVPCLGGLDSGRILRMHALAGGRGPWLVTRGWCAECPAGGGAEHPATGALERARELLCDAGVAETALPRLVTADDDLAPVVPGIPDPVAEGAVSRRGFFRHMVGHAANTVDGLQASQEAAGEGPPRPLVDRIPAPPREREVAALNIITGENLPDAARPALGIDAAACCNSRICAALCPTGALMGVQAEAGSGLDFNPESCIRCRLCEGVCPERALRVEDRGGEAQALIRHAERRCEECLHPFPERGGERLCPSCRKKHGLLEGGGHELLFGGRGGSRESDKRASQNAITS